jgi:hypothetical protein
VTSMIVKNESCHEKLWWPEAERVADLDLTESLEVLIVGREDYRDLVVEHGGYGVVDRLGSDVIALTI